MEPFQGVLARVDSSDAVDSSDSSMEIADSSDSSMDVSALRTTVTASELIRTEGLAGAKDPAVAPASTTKPLGPVATSEIESLTEVPSCPRQIAAQRNSVSMWAFQVHRNA